MSSSLIILLLLNLRYFLKEQDVLSIPGLKTI